MSRCFVALKGRTLGLGIATLGMVLVTPDAALLRVQERAGASTPVITVWRYVMAGVLSSVVSLLTQGGAAQVVAGMRPAPFSVAIASILMMSTNVGFTLSLLKVDPAKALLLISLNPLWAALLGYVLLHDRLPLRTVVAQVLSLIAMVLMLYPSLAALLAPAPVAAAVAGDSGGGDGGVPDELLDLIPLATGLLQAALLIWVRAASIRCPAASMDAVPALGAFLTALVAVALARAQGGRHWSPGALLAGLQPPFWLALVATGLGLAGYNAACTIAPRYLTGAEVALVLLGESVGGPLWVFVAFGDVPSSWTLASGALLMTTLIGHEIAGMLAGDDAQSAPGSAVPGSRVASIPPSPALLSASAPLEIRGGAGGWNCALLPASAGAAAGAFANGHAYARSPPSGRDSGVSLLLSPASREALLAGFHGGGLKQNGAFSASSL